MPVSDRLEDHTGYNNRQKLLDYLFTMINPVYAYRQYKDTLMEKGYIKPPTDHPFRKGGW